MSLDVLFSRSYNYTANNYNHPARAGWLFCCLKREVVSVADKLTPKQQQFVREYLIDFNATQAAIRAGYSPKTAQVIGAENLKKPMVAAEIQRLGQKTAQKLEITRESIMQELAAIGFARTSDYVRVETEPTTRLGIHPLTGEVVSLPSYLQTVRITNTADLPEEKAAALAGIKQGANGIEVKLHDKVRALELLGKAMGVFDSGRDTSTEASNNLFEAIVESAQEELDTDDIPEIKQEATAGADVVE